MIKFLFTRFEEIIGSLMLGVMTIVAFANVIVRYCTVYSFAWTEELTINFFVWIVLLGASREFREGGHLSMSLLYSALPSVPRFACYMLGVVCTCIFFGVLAWLGGLEILDEMSLDATSESLGIPVWWYTIATPLFSLLIIFRVLQRAVRDVILNRI